MREIRNLFLAVATACVCQAALAAEPLSKLALLSMIGDKLTVVTYQPQGTSALNRNHQLDVPMASPFFDRVALLTLQEALAKRLPSERFATLAAPAPGSDFDPNLLFDGYSVVAANPMQAPLMNAGFTHLLVVAKFRSAAKLRYVDGTFGTGALNGLGFYVDQELRSFNADARQTETGFLAPYAYFRVALLALQPLKLVAEERITVNSAQSAGAFKTGQDAFEALPQDKKIVLLKALVESGIAQAVPRLLSALP